VTSVLAKSRPWLTIITAMADNKKEQPSNNSAGMFACGNASQKPPKQTR
jgi:hypothetical protein